MKRSALLPQRLRSASQTTGFEARGKIPSEEEEFERVSIFRAMFDNADRMLGVFVATSRDYRDYKARHKSGGVPIAASSSPPSGEKEP
jgi:hypothetical protein